MPTWQNESIHSTHTEVYQTNRTSMLVIPTGVYPYTPIPHSLYSQRCITRCSVIIGQFCHTWLATVQCIIALGANPWVKVHQNRRWMLPAQVYHPAKFRHPVSTLARNILQKICARTSKEVKTETNKQTVNDIAPPACGDNEPKKVAL